ncbi:hypothetical protein [Microbulbifer okhotskensis]|uniref:hypothetical protein n=1 Tax=Microbulbifer okhotskensis TaxID=2926617 RepID=UPI00359C8CD2
MVKANPSEHQDEIEVFLPSHSPELNPDEYLNCGHKRDAYGGIPARPKEKLENKVLSHTRMLQKKPAREPPTFSMNQLNMQQK